MREAVLELRRGKGMVLDPEPTTTPGAPGRSSPTRSSTPTTLPEGAPAFPQPDGTVKTSAAWLIERAGFAKGYGNGRVSLSTKHTLALTNRGGATTADLLALAREIRDGVQSDLRHRPPPRTHPHQLHPLTLRELASQVRPGSFDRGRRVEVEPGVDVGEQDRAYVVGGGRAADRHPGQLGQLVVGEAVDVAGRLVLREQPRVRTAAGRRRRARSARRRRTARAAAPPPGRGRRRARRSTVGQTSSVTPASARCATSVRVLDRPHAVTDPLRAEPVQARPHALGAAQLAAVRRGEQAGSVGDLERLARTPAPHPGARRSTARTRRRRGRRTAPPAGPASGRPAGAGSGWPRSRSRPCTPVASDASRAASRTRSVKAVIPPKCAAYPLGSTWISSQRDPSRGLVLGRLPHQPAYARPRCVTTDRAMS